MFAVKQIEKLEEERVQMDIVRPGESMRQGSKKVDLGSPGIVQHLINTARINAG